MQTGSYSIEKLCHFKCQKCKLYLSVRDAHLFPEQVWSCPHCYQEISSIDSFQTLLHFQCPFCKKWWMLAENHAGNKKQYCPWCKEHVDFQQKEETPTETKCPNQIYEPAEKVSPRPLEGLPDLSGGTKHEKNQDLPPLKNNPNSKPRSLTMEESTRPQRIIEEISHIIRDNSRLFFSGGIHLVAEKIVTMLEEDFGFEPKKK